MSAAASLTGELPQEERARVDADEAYQRLLARLSHQSVVKHYDAYADVPWDEPEIGLPAFLTLIMIPLTFSIANGLAFGITAHALLKLVRGKISKSDWLLLVLAALFVGRFAWLAGG